MVKHSIGAILFLLVLCGWVAFHKKRPDLPSDKSLIRNFQEHRADFERLATMVNEAPKAHEEGISEQRSKEYNLLFSRLTDFPADTLFKRADGLFIYISADWLGPDENESVRVEKGYLYCTVEPSPLVNSLDEMGFESGGKHYKKIDEHWYLYYEGSVNHPE